MVMFIGRKDEMDTLLKINSSKKAELIILYGRRRVGKSRLLTEFAKKTDALYLLSDLSKNILDILSGQVPDDFVKFNDWDDFFEFILKSRYKTIIIDEFQYLYNVDASWPSILQRWWEKIKETDKTIILSGSIISTIYKISKGYGSALYGRKTYDIKITPLKFRYIGGFFPGYSKEDLVKIYSIAGGVPRYLEEFDSSIDIKENIKNKIIDKTSFLYNEPINLFFEEFRDPTPYISIMTAIIQGYVRFADISVASKIENNRLPKYLTVLERVSLIEKELVVTENKIKSKNTRYKITDNFYRFWFTFIFKNKAAIELGLNDDVLNSIWKNFNSYVGKCFEAICIEYLIEHRPIKFTNIGRWWHKDKEIDIVALNADTKDILFVECKWKDLSLRQAEKILLDLKEKSSFVDWNLGSRKDYFGIVAKNIEGKDELRSKGFIVFDLDDF